MDLQQERYELPLLKRKQKPYDSLQTTKLKLCHVRLLSIVGFLPRGGEGGTRANFCRVCAADLSEPLPHYGPTLGLKVI